MAQRRKLISDKMKAKRAAQAEQQKHLIAQEVGEFGKKSSARKAEPPSQETLVEEQEEQEEMSSASERKKKALKKQGGKIVRGEQEDSQSEQ